MRLAISFVDFNDVDYCLKVRSLDLRVVYDGRNSLSTVVGRPSPPNVFRSPPNTIGFLIGLVGSFGVSSFGQ